MSDPALVAAVRERRLVLFAGSGICFDAGLPGWAGLISRIADALEARSLIDGAYKRTVEDFVAAGDLATAAEVLSARTSRFELAESIRLILTPSKPSPVVKALQCLRPRGVVTTNFDRLTEEVVGPHPWRLGNSESDLAVVPGAVGSGRPFVWKLHGDYDNSLEAADDATARGGPFLVLTKGDFAALVQGDRGRQLTSGLLAVLQSHPVLFIGYSMTDPDIARALTWLSANLRFGHRSWFLSLAGDTRRTLPSNVSEISPISTWAELAPWVAQLCAESQKVAATPIGGSAHGPTPEELAAYKAVSRYLSNLESPELTERVIASALFEDMRQAEDFELTWVSSRIEEVLGLGPSLAASLASATVRLLVEMSVAERHGESVSIRKAQAERLADKANEVWAEERRRFFGSLIARLPIEARDQSSSWLDTVENVLISVCSSLGEGMAIWASRGIGGDIGWPDVEPIVSEQIADSEGQRLATGVLRLLLSEPSDQEIPYLYRVLASTYLANTVRLDPVASAHLRDSLARYELYIDANVLLPLLVADHPQHAATKAVIEDSLNAGVRVAVLPQFVNEVISHRNVARRELREFEGDVQALRHVADVMGPRTNVFVQGYLNQRPGGQLGNQMPWQQYLAQYSENAVWAGIHAARVEVVEPGAEALGGSIYRRVLPLIREEWRRKMGGPREDVLNAHEAIQFAHIYLRREAVKDGTSHVWFLSNETVLQRVFNSEPDRWRLPATFPYSAWVAFLASRLIHGPRDPKAIVLAILKGRPQAFDLPTPVAVVRDKAFAGRVASQAENEALEYAYSDFDVMKRLENAQRALARRGREGETAKAFAVARHEAVAEVSEALDAQIGRLKDELTQAKQRIRDLESTAPASTDEPSPSRRRRRRGKTAH